MSKIEKTFADISIRTELRPGDLSNIIYQQTLLYQEEHNFGFEFEMYALAGMHEFCKNYNLEKDRIWICEHNDKIIGSILVMHRENNSSQLRFFYVDKDYRGIGLGKKLMQLCVDFIKEKNYKLSYLWTFEGLDSAISLYTKNGFTLTEQIKTQTFGKVVNEQRFDLII